MPSPNGSRCMHGAGASDVVDEVDAGFEALTVEGPRYALHFRGSYETFRPWSDRVD